MDGYEAYEVLAGLQSKVIPTLTGRPNTVLRLEGEHVVVATLKSPCGRRVPIGWVQSALDRLVDEKAVVISVESVGYRSAFIGAVLATIPGVVVSPGVVRLPGARPGLAR